MALLSVAAPAPGRVWRIDRRVFVGSGWKPAILAVYAFWLLVVGAHHEPWADEAQAWLIARDNGLAEILLHRARYEGTPALWHMLLWACIRCGLPYAALHLIPAAVALAGGAILLWRAPFPPPLRGLLLFSYFGAYQFAVVARSYTLDLLLLPALAALFPRRTERPIAYGVLIGVLANCNTHSFLAAAVLGCELGWALLSERRFGRDALAGAAIALLLGLAAMAVAWQPHDNGFLQGSKPPLLVGALTYLREAFINRAYFWSASKPTGFGVEGGILLSILLLLPSAVMFRRAGRAWLAAALFAALFAFSAFAYSSEWHAGILFLCWIFLLWISWPALESRASLRHWVIGTVAAIGVVQAGQAALTGARDIGRPFSSARQASGLVAEWKSRHPGGTIAVAGFKAFAVQPYFPQNIFANYHGGEARPSYILWSTGEPWHAFDIVGEAHKAFAARYDLALVSNDHLSPAGLARLESAAARDGYRRLALCPGSMWWKGYHRENDSLLLLTRVADENGSP